MYFWLISRNWNWFSLFIPLTRSSRHSSCQKERRNKKKIRKKKEKTRRSRILEEIAKLKWNINAFEHKQQTTISRSQYSMTYNINSVMITKCQCRKKIQHSADILLFAFLEVFCETPSPSHPLFSIHSLRNVDHSFYFHVDYNLFFRSITKSS